MRQYYLDLFVFLGVKEKRMDVVSATQTQDQGKKKKRSHSCITKKASLLGTMWRGGAYSLLLSRKRWSEDWNAWDEVSFAGGEREVAIYEARERPGISLVKPKDGFVTGVAASYFTFSCFFM